MNESPRRDARLDARPFTSAPAAAALPGETGAEPAPLTFGRIFWHFAIGGLLASILGLVVAPRLLWTWGVAEERITDWTLGIWIALLVIALAPLARACEREYREMLGD
jgi:hypothetical protein